MRVTLSQNSRHPFPHIMTHKKTIRSVTLVATATTTMKTSGEKCKATHTDVMLMDFLANLHAETNSRLEVISLRIGYDFDLGQARKAVFDKLGDVDGLTIDQRYQFAIFWRINHNDLRCSWACWHKLDSVTFLGSWRSEGGCLGVLL